MRNFSYIAMAVILPALIALFSCMGGGMLSNDPLKPSPALKDGTVDPLTNAITMSKSGITVTVEHWSKEKLDRKFTTVDSRSIFFFIESWEQSYQTEVFYITIKNDNPRKINILFKDTILEDEREYVYKPVMLDFIKYKFQTKKMMDIKTKNGLDRAGELLLTERLGTSGEIGGGQTVEGFLPFTIPSTQAEKVWLTIAMEKEPEVVTRAYEQVSFRFDYIQDLVLRARITTTRR